MRANNGTEVLGGQGGGVEIGFCVGDKVNYLSEVVRKDLNSVVASSRPGELGNTVDGDVSPGSRGDGERLHEAEGREMGSLVSRASVATGEEGSDEGGVEGKIMDRQKSWRVLAWPKWPVGRGS
jgi:hypothetical protein